MKLRQENSQLRVELSDTHVKESVLQDSLNQTAAIAEKRAILLSKVVDKVDQHSKVLKDYDRLTEEKDKLRRDLQQMQVQMDNATRLTCELRETSSEKALALDLLSSKLQEERKERRKVAGALKNALNLLQDNIFGSDTNAMSFNSIIAQLVDILSAGEDSTKMDCDLKKYEDPKPLVTYTSGDLGLVPKKITKQKPKV